MRKTLFVLLAICLLASCSLFSKDPVELYSIAVQDAKVQVEQAATMDEVIAAVDTLKFRAEAISKEYAGELQNIKEDHKALETAQARINDALIDFGLELSKKISTYDTDEAQAAKLFSIIQSLSEL